MKKRAQTTHIQGEKSRMLFALVSFWAFLGTVFVLSQFGLVPDYIDGERRVSRETSYTEENLFPEAGEDRTEFSAQVRSLSDFRREENTAPIVNPERIVIRSLGKDIVISNPESTSIDVLAEGLKSSVVRYPDSGTLDRDGNIFIFGHSSSLRNVRNELYKAFNGIQTLTEGDTIKLIGGGKEYIYRVTNVYQADATTDKIELGTHDGQRLTLATCNVLAEKSDRWIVESELVGSYKAGELL